MKSTVLTICLLMSVNIMNALAQEPVSYHTVRIENLNIFYREAGPTNAPVILLLHGVPTSSRMYQPMLESSLSRKYRLIAPDFPGFGHSSWPDPKEFSYTFDHLARVTEAFTEALHLRHYTLFLHDYGGPVGMRMAVDQPEKVEAIIIQNAVSHEEGLSPLWAARRAFWQDRASQEPAVSCKAFLSLTAPATGISARPRILSGLIPTPGRTSFIF